MHSVPSTLSIAVPVTIWAALEAGVLCVLQSPALRLNRPRSRRLLCTPLSADKYLRPFESTFGKGQTLREIVQEQ